MMAALNKTHTLWVNQAGTLQASAYASACCLQIRLAPLTV